MIKMTEKQHHIIESARKSKKNPEKTLAKFFGNNWFDAGWKVSLMDVVTVFYDDSKVEIVEKPTDED